jgi:hypothetical protein
MGDAPSRREEEAEAAASMGDRPGVAVPVAQPASRPAQVTRAKRGRVVNMTGELNMGFRDGDPNQDKVST